MNRIVLRIKQDARSLFKIWHVYEYFPQKCRSFYSPKQELSLDETTISWRGHLKFRTSKVVVSHAGGYQCFRGSYSLYRTLVNTYKTVQSYNQSAII